MRHSDLCLAKWNALTSSVRKGLANPSLIVALKALSLISPSLLCSRLWCHAEDLIPRLLSLRPQETLQELTSTLEEAPQKMHPNKQGWVFGIGDRWRPGLFRRQNPTGQPQSSLVGQSIDGEETQATFPPDRKQTSTETLPPSGPPKFVTAVVKPVSARAASLKAFAQKAPERLWHRHKVVQVTLFTPPLLFRPNFFLRRKSQSPLTGAHNLSVQPAYRISDQVVSGAVDAYYRGYNSMHRGKQQNSASTEKVQAWKLWIMCDCLSTVWRWWCMCWV